MTRAQLHSVAWIAMILLIGTSFYGCDDDMTWSVSGSDEDSASRSKPEDSFARIVDMFRRGVDTNVRGIRGGFVTQNSDGVSRLSVQNEVTEKLFPPSIPGQSYRGRITVTSRYNYSLLQNQEDAPEDEERDSNSNRSSDSLSLDDDPWHDGSQDKPLGDMYAPSTQSNPLLESVTAKPVTRHADEEERRYDLIYENGRWILMTELDPETERSIANAFQHALDMQF